MIGVYEITLLLSTLAGAIGFGKQSSAIKSLIILMAYTTVHEWIVHARVLSNTSAAYWIYAGVSLAFYLEFIRRSLSDKFIRVILFGISTSFVVLGLYGSWYWSVDFPSQFVVSGIPFIVIGCLLLLYHMLQNISEQSITTNPMFIITAAIFIYQCVAFVYLGCVNYLMNQEAEIQLLHTIHRWTSILFYATLGYAFLLSRWNSRKLATT